MWAIRILTGPQAGEILDLKMGRNVIGRSPQCDIKITSNGVSKEHVELTVFKEKIVIKDLQSSNGTFLNGVRVQTGSMRLGDKLGIHNILVDIVPAGSAKIQPPAPVHASHFNTTPAIPNSMPYQGYPQGSPHGIHGVPGGAMPHGMPGGAAPQPAPAYQAGGLQGLTDKIAEYVEKVALPGIYKLPTFIEFKMVLLGFVVLFIFTTTLLSMIPMVAISRASILTESKRRAGSIARTLATMNQTALLQNSYSTLSTNQAESEDGVKQVLIVQQSDGMILAPATRAGTIPDLPFVHVARREMRPHTAEVDSSTIGASFPIGLFDPNTGEQAVKAHAIVLYDTASMAFDDGRAISLFMQSLVIASIVGLILFYFMYKLIEYPISNLNAQLDVAMRDKKDSTEVEFIFPALQALVGNINSLLTRYIHGVKDEEQSGNFVNKEGEAENLIQMVGFPAMTLNKEGRIIASSTSFAHLVRSEVSSLQNQMYTAIPDTALQQNIEGLVGRSRENPRSIQTDQLEFSGHLCNLSCQAFASSASEVDYYLITVSPVEGG